MVTNLKIKVSVEKPREGNLHVYFFPHFTKPSPVDLIGERGERRETLFRRKSLFGITRLFPSFFIERPVFIARISFLISPPFFNLSSLLTRLPFYFG